MVRDRTTRGGPNRRAARRERRRRVNEHGDPSGAPVCAFHGTPSCGAGFESIDEPARDRRLRVLAPDRPGIGKSGGPALVTVADYPDRIAALADALGIDRFAVLGHSGGGPFAVACAMGLADRVTATAVAAGSRRSSTP